MRISIFGLGYVGAVSGACLAREGNDVIGVDVNPDKVRFVRSGKSPVVERGIGDVFRRAAREGRLTATTSAGEAVAGSDLSFVCVGTPSLPNGGLDETALRSVSREIGAAIAAKKGSRHLVVVRSTVLPGTTMQAVRPLLEEGSGLRAGKGFGLAYNPEFLREGCSVDDFYHPPRTVAGALAPRDLATLESLYGFVAAPFFRTSIPVAEMIKYADNAFHATKVVFANEIDLACSKAGVDGREVMGLLVADQKLNVSPAYLRPGFAFGGSCLPKDLRALLQFARRSDIDLPLLGSVMESNERHVARGIDRVLATGRRKIGVLGISFKAGTDDLRESPMVRLVEALIGKGLDVRVYDKNVSVARLVGSNRRYIEKGIPHIAEILVPAASSLSRWGEALVIGNEGEDGEHARLARAFRKRGVVVDLAGVLRGDIEPPPSEEDSTDSRDRSHALTG